jgi:hypothetical protein
MRKRHSSAREARVFDSWLDEPGPYMNLMPEGSRLAPADGRRGQVRSDALDPAAAVGGDSVMADAQRRSESVGIS